MFGMLSYNCIQHSKGVKNCLLDSVMRYGAWTGINNTTYYPKFLACNIRESCYHKVTKAELQNAPVESPKGRSHILQEVLEEGPILFQEAEEVSQERHVRIWKAQVDIFPFYMSSGFQIMHMIHGCTAILWEWDAADPTIA